MTSEERTLLFNRQGGVCAVCGRYMERPQFAHAIARTKENYHHYGREVIDSPLNGALVCSLACNDAVNIGHKPLEAQRLAERIIRREK